MQYESALIKEHSSYFALKCCALLETLTWSKITKTTYKIDQNTEKSSNQSSTLVKYLV